MENQHNTKKPNDKENNDESPVQKALMFWRMNQMGHLRDLFLVIGGATYILGYIVWSINAYVKGLGMLPALEAQYFVAGIIPLLIILLVYFTIRAFRPFCDSIFKFIVITFPKKWHFSLLMLAYFIPMVVGSAMLYFHYLHTDSMVVLQILLILWFISFLSAHYVPHIRFIGERHEDLPIYRITFTSLFRIASYVYVLLLSFVAVSIYISFLYPLIPQEFGGLRPQSAYLDIIHDKTSANTYSEIFPDDVHVNNISVIRSKMVDIYYSGSDVMLLKLPRQSDRNSQTFKVKQSIVQTVTWCESSDNETEINPSD